MKVRIISILVCLYVALASTSYLPTTYADVWPATESLPQEEKEALLAENPIQLLQNKTGEWSITCFAACDDGRIAVGFHPLDKGVVYICDENGVFLYGYSFSCTGNYAISFEGDFLSICFYRSNMVWTFDPDGNAVNVQRIGAGKIHKLTQLQYGDRKYKLEREIRFADEEYARLVVTEANGAEKILYDVTTEHNAKVIFVYVILLVCAIGWVCIFIHRIREGPSPETKEE